MNSKKIMKIVTTLLMIASVLSVFTRVSANDIPSIPSAQAIGNTTSVTGTVGRVIWVVQAICYGAAVVLLILLGIKFMTASPEGKAEIKKSAVIYVVGAILVFFASVILQIIKDSQFVTSKN